MNIVIIDNYDSFTYNLSHLVEKIISKEVTVLCNDKFEMADLKAFDKIILSPGPGLPNEAGKTLEVIEQFKDNKPILGVCLGLQAIGVAFNCKLKNLDNVYHGIEKPIYFTNNKTLIYKEVKEGTKVGRYHSWVIDENHLNKDLLITATDEDGNIMSLKHKIFELEGVQFHPESIMTLEGERIMRNWLLI
jgi:anthranilate synthase component II